MSQIVTVTLGSRSTLRNFWRCTSVLTKRCCSLASTHITCVCGWPPGSRVVSAAKFSPRASSRTIGCNSSPLILSDMGSSPHAGVRNAYDTSLIEKGRTPTTTMGHETLARASLRLWPGQILARLILSPLLRRLLLLGGLLGLELRVEHNEYDPYETHQPDPARQADTQYTI